VLLSDFISLILIYLYYFKTRVNNLVLLISPKTVVFTLVDQNYSLIVAEIQHQISVYI